LTLVFPLTLALALACFGMRRLHENERWTL
jgi:hypothetical protein